MKIEGFDPVVSLPERAVAPAGGSAPKGAFDGVIAQALADTSAMQSKADVEATKLALGAGNIHEAAIALEKADVSMRLLVRARNKVVEAYQEIMRMQM